MLILESRGKKGVRKAGFICTLTRLLFKSAQKLVKKYSQNLSLQFHKPLSGALLIMLAILDILIFYPQTSQAVIMGNSQNLAGIIKNIDHYTPTITEQDAIDKISNSNDSQYLDKPLIVITKTRAEMDREKAAKLAQDKRITLARERAKVTATTQVNSNPTSSINSYWYGFCTWYVAKKRTDIPGNWGNARSWLTSAQRIAWPTGSEPKPGAIIVTKESWAGHVGYVESIDDNTITISEMNFRGWGRVTNRTLSKNDPVIRGYIY